jgi:arabinose-5-phosphate isomerase
VTAVVKSGAAKRGGKSRSPDDLGVASRVLRLEADGIRALAHSLGDSFVRAIDLLSGRTGRIVVTGMGKSGHIGR